MSSRLVLILTTRRIGVAAGTAAVLVGLLLAVSTSLGASPTGPPRFSGVLNEEFFSTRAMIALGLRAEGLVTKWTAYYGTSATGPWTTVNDGIDDAKASEATIQIGAHDNQMGTGGSGGEYDVFLRGLKPGTPYYARFVASNEDGSAEEVIPFTTQQVATPEIDKHYSGYSPNLTSFRGGPTGDQTARFVAKIDANGADATYHFEYALSSSGPWQEFTSGASGTIGAGKEYAWEEASLSALTPETTYYVRVKARNEKGETTQARYAEGSEQLDSFTTGTAKPQVGTPEVRNVTGVSAHLKANVAPHGSETVWRLEYATSESGPWSPVPGGAGTISLADAEAAPYRSFGALSGVTLAGLSPATTYHVRLFAENTCASRCGSVTSESATFVTSGPPSVSTYAVHALHGEALRLLGAVNPNSSPTSAEQLVTLEGHPTGGTFTLTFDGQTTEAIAYNASGERVANALHKLEVQEGGKKRELEVGVEGPAGGPYTVYFARLESGVSEPSIEGSGLGLAPVGGSVAVVTTLVGGVAYDASAHFEYVSQKQFEASGWSAATSTPEQSLGSGATPVVIGQDLPALTAGETYRYRISATSTLPGNPVVDGSEQSLTVPVPPKPALEETCPNQAFRTGPSAHLPDCRAYEQVTPVDKEGAAEPFSYSLFHSVSPVVLIGEGGDNVGLEDLLVTFGRSAGSGQSPYFFDRDGLAQGWLVTAGSPQPETGGDHIQPQAYSANLSEVAFESNYALTPFNSPEAEYKIGPAGGPYATVAVVPFQDREGTSWVAANGEFSTLVLATTDHVPLDGSPAKSTGTKSGTDLYEYAGGQLRRLNVDSEGNTVGTCGASVVRGMEQGARRMITSSPHTVSANGSRVFFEAVPTGEKCSEPANLYMRVAGEKTVDIGAYKFVAADSEGEKVLLGKSSGTNPGLYLYLTGSETASFLPSSTIALGTENVPTVLTVSADLSAVYIYRGQSLYRYDVGGQTLQFLFEAGEGRTEVSVEVSADGRYAYVNAGAISGLFGNASDQVFRYDDVEKVVECVSCASPYDPEPKQPSFLGGSDGQPFFAGEPVQSFFSAGGGFAFFTTPAALVREDVDGERPIEVTEISAFPDTGKTTSPSSDVYEWRRDGLNGCVKPQGCLALITDGQGGYMNLLLGSANEGRDVFVYTRSKLLAQDNDTSGDIYDARIGGGFAGPPPRPVECTGDACSTPLSAPNDVSPSSLTFSGNGNVAPLVTPAPKATTKRKIVRKPGKRKKKPGRKTRAKKTGNGRRAGR